MPFCVLQDSVPVPVWPGLDIDTRRLESVFPDFPWILESRRGRGMRPRRFKNDSVTGETLPAAPQGKGHRGYTECDEHDGHQGGRLGIHTRLGILDDGFGGLEQPEVPQQDLAAAVIGEERNLLMLAAVEPDRVAGKLAFIGGDWPIP